MLRLFALFTTYLVSASFTATFMNEFDNRQLKQPIEIDAVFFIYKSHISVKSIYRTTKEILPTIPEYGSRQKINFVNGNIYNPNSKFYQPTASIAEVTAYVQYCYFDNIGRRYKLLTNSVVPISATHLDFAFKLINDDKALHGLNLIQY